MPFGLCNAPACFARLMQACLNEQIFQILLVYLDDILIFSKTFEEHLERLEMVLKRLREHGLKLKLEKCTFLRRRVTYLGHEVSGAGIAPEPEKIAVVQEWPVPYKLLRNSEPSSASQVTIEDSLKALPR